MEMDEFVALRLYFNCDLVRMHTFHLQALTIWEEVRLPIRQIQDMGILLNDIREILQQIWPGCRTNIFGSLATGLLFKDSDVDVKVDLPPHCEDDTDECLQKIKLYIAKYRTDFKYLFSVPVTRVPVIVLKHVVSNIRCDITFTGAIAVEASKLLEFLLRLDKRAFMLAVLIKFWSKHYRLTGTKTLPNYAVTLLVIFFLQQKGILPSVASLQTDVPCAGTEGWNTAFDDSPDYECYNNESLYNLLGGFFLYYRNFNYKDLVVSTSFGYPVQKKFLGIRDGGLYVEDPFELSRNITMGVNVELTRKMYRAFNFAADCYNKYPSFEFLVKLVRKENIQSIERHGVIRFLRCTITWTYYCCIAILCFLTFIYFCFLASRLLK